MIKRYIENGNKIEKESTPIFTENYDVVIVGGGTAGSCAAMAAAKEGLSTLCVELNSFLGGLGTAIVTGYYAGDDVDGLFSEIDKEIKADSLTCYSDKKKWCEGIHVEAKKNVYEKKYREFGGKVYYQSIATAVYVENSEVCGLQIIKDGKLLDISCKVVIDGTAESNICRIAHLETHMGRVKDGRCQNFSASAFVLNQNNELEHVYRDNGFVDTADMCDISSKITKSYSEIESIGAYSVAKNPNKIIALCCMIGTREGLCSVGYDRLTTENLLHFTDVNKPTFAISGPYDSHLHDSAMEDDIVNDFLSCKLKDMVLTVPMPYGGMIVKDIEGIVTTGLSMDVDHNAIPPARLKKNSIRSGETAALIAKAKIQTGKKLIDCYDDVKEMLIKRNLYLEKAEIPKFILKAKENTKLALESPNVNYSGCGIYVASREVPEDTLFEYVMSNEEPLASNSALALGLKGNKRAISKLKELVETNEYALYLIGKLNDGSENEYISKYLKSDNYSLFCFAYTAILRRCEVGDKIAINYIEQILNDDAFTKKLKFNGKIYQTVLDNTDKIKEYGEKVLKKEAERN